MTSSAKKYDNKKYIEQLKKKIKKLKKEKNAVIIAHNYQRDEIQEIADITGDSLALSQAAVKVDADILVFCGVDFMAESAAILNPDKTVLLPVREATCPMADMVNVESLAEMRAEHPDAAVVCYVNSTAVIKAKSDVCCTSSNAVDVVRAMPQKDIIFIPDKNLGRYVQSKLPEKNIVLWEGFCPTHIRVSSDHIKKAKALHPNAKIMVHPECLKEVIDMADCVCSTAGMFKYASASDAKEFIIATETGMLFGLNAQNPEKQFYPASERMICPAMKLITLGWVEHSLENMVYEMKVPEDIRVEAERALNKMLQITKEKKWSVLTGY